MEENKNFCELSEKEMLDVEGGNPLAILAGVGAVWVSYEIGYAVGKAICHGTSKK